MAPTLSHENHLRAENSTIDSVFTFEQVAGAMSDEVEELDLGVPEW